MKAVLLFIEILLKWNEVYDYAKGWIMMIFIKWNFKMHYYNDLYDHK